MQVLKLLISLVIKKYKVPFFIMKLAVLKDDDGTPGTMTQVPVHGRPSLLGTILSGNAAVWLMLYSGFPRTLAVLFSHLHCLLRPHPELYLAQFP